MGVYVVLVPVLRSMCTKHGADECYTVITSVKSIQGERPFRRPPPPLSSSSSSSMVLQSNVDLRLLPVSCVFVFINICLYTISQNVFWSS
jgi:hypothetical protein